MISPITISERKTQGNGARKPFSRNFPCPVCGGCDEASRENGSRCGGYLATDPKTGITYARCTKSELAGNIERRNDGTFPHRMNGKPCRCGTVHNDLNPGQKPIRRNGNGHGSNTKRKTVARYDYLDEEERLLNQVCRTNPKGFFQQRPDGADGWIRSLKEGEHYQTVDYETGEKVWYHVQATLDKGRTIPPDAPRKTFPAARRVLYHLSELLKADPSEIPFTTEGEKDVLNLESIGCVATCNPEGAGKWHHVADHAREVLAGRPVVILPDNDDRGQSHARDVARSLHGAAASIKVIALPGLPEKGDVSDWIAARKAEGMTAPEIKAALLDIVQATPEWHPAATDAAPAGAGITTSAIEWEEPVLFDDFNVPEIDPRLFPGWMAEYIQAVSEHNQTPTALPAMVALPVCATCLQKKFIVSPFPGYAEPLNIWTLTALPPATRKSPVFNAMTAPLAEWEQAEAERLQPDIDRITTERNVLQDRIKRLQSDAANAEDPGERKRLIDEICCLKEELPAALITPRLWTSDCTPERLQNLLLDHGESMSLLSDEGGIFEILSGLYNDGRVNLDVFLQAHAGSPVRVDRQTRTVCLNAPALTLGLAVQPEILREMNRGSKRRFRGIGALARFLYAIPPSNIGSRDIFKQIPIPAQVSSEYSRRVKSLINIPTPEYPNVLSLDGKALEAWKTFSQFIESNQGNGKTYESIQDWTGKLPGAALRIAGNFHVAEYGEGNPTIGLHTMENALDLSNLLIEHAQAAFGTMETDPVIEDAQLIFKWIVANGRERFSKHECHRAVRGKVHKVERLEKGLGELTGRGYISSPDREPTPGRPRITYTVNPKIMKGGK